jgi:hypothetical protein
MDTEADSARGNGQGFVFGELLIAVLLLVVAVSSMAALMYSVSHREDARETSSCVQTSVAPGSKCPRPAQVGGGPGLLRSDCDQEASGSKRCKDDRASGDSGAVIVRSRTDSLALAIAAKKEKAARSAPRTDRGFVR